MLTDNKFSIVILVSLFLLQNIHHLKMYDVLGIVICFQVPYAGPSTIFKMLLQHPIRSIYKYTHILGHLGS